MGHLRDVEVPAETVTLGGIPIRLRALSFKEVATLGKAHIGTIAGGWSALGPMLQQHGAPLSSETAFAAFLDECADLIADLIAVAADEPDSRDVVLTLPLDMQLRATATIFRLTAASEDPQSILRDFREAMAFASETQH